MGVLGFLFGLGKSREEKMAIFVLEKAQQHVAAMIKRSEAYWDLCNEHSWKKREMDNITASAFIRLFFTTLEHEFGQKGEHAIDDCTRHMSPELCELIDSFSVLCPKTNGKAIPDHMRSNCARCLPLKLPIPMQSNMCERQAQISDAFMDESMKIQSEVIQFKDRFL